MIEYAMYFRDMQMNMNNIREAQGRNFADRYSWAL